MSAQPVEDVDLLRRLLRNEASVAEIRASLVPEDAAAFERRWRERQSTSEVLDPAGDRAFLEGWAHTAVVTLNLGHDGYRAMLASVDEKLRRAAAGEDIGSKEWDWREYFRSRGVDV